VPDSSLLSVDGLCVAYGRSQVLFDVSLEVPALGAVAVLGRHGGGKTTLLTAIMGDVPAMRGATRFKGQDVTRLPTERRVRLGLGHVPQEHSVCARLSVRENLAVVGLGHRDAKARQDILDIFPKLGQRLDQPAGTLSGGERKMLAIARALLLKPRLLLLDEPTEGVWVGVIEEITDRLRQLVADMAVLIVEQHLELALGVADQVYVLDRGRVALRGPSSEIRDNPRLLQHLAP